MKKQAITKQNRVFILILAVNIMNGYAIYCIIEAPFHHINGNKVNVNIGFIINHKIDF